MLDRVATEALRSGSPGRLEASIRDGASAEMADLAREFGRRTDITEHSFAFMVEDTEEGPEYWHVPFGVDLRALPREEREEFLARRNEEFLRWVEEFEEP